MEESFKIDNDKTADWAIAQIKAAETERDRLITLAQEQITDLQDRIRELTDKCNSDTAYLKSMLAMYFDTVQTKETKTQKTYKLLSGSLVFKKPSVKINHDDDALIAYLKETDGADFIKVKESVDWAEFKKQLTISDAGEIIDTELGTIVPENVCSLEEVPASFNIKY